MGSLGRTRNAAGVCDRDEQFQIPQIEAHG
jgi:hypothetical protein